MGCLGEGKGKKCRSTDLNGSRVGGLSKYADDVKVLDSSGMVGLVMRCGFRKPSPGFHRYVI